MTDFEAVFVADNRAPFISADIGKDSISIVLNKSDQSRTDRSGTYTVALEYYLPNTDLSSSDLEPSVYQQIQVIVTDTSTKQDTAQETVQDIIQELEL